MQAVKKYDPYRGSSSRHMRRGGSAPTSSVHPQQLAAREDRDHAGATQAVLQPRKEKEKIEALGFERGRSCSPSGSTSRSRTCGRWSSDWLGRGVARRAAHSRRGRQPHFLDLVPARRRRVPTRRSRAPSSATSCARSSRSSPRPCTGASRPIFHDRLLADPPLTLQEIGERYGISASARGSSRNGCWIGCAPISRASSATTVDVMLGRED